MKRINVLCLIICTVLINNLYAQRGYFNAPYIRYEADSGNLTNATITAKSYAQSDLQSEASAQVCVNLSDSGAAVDWTVSSAGDGLVVRYSVPNGQSGVIEVYADNVLIDTLNLTSYYSWQFLGTIDPTIPNKNPKKRFDEVRMRLPSKILAGGNLKLVRKSGTVYIDFAELESVPDSVFSSAGDILYKGDGSDLQTIIDQNGGKTIYLPAGIYNVNRELYFGVNNTVLKGAGIWYTQINFTGNGTTQHGGLRANALGVSFSDLYLTTIRNSRTNSYKAINGVFTSSSKISNVWAEHFECGAWIGQYNTGGPAYADGFIMSDCRFRNNFADGINLCKGTRNSLIEHCNFRNNGDDDMAIWSANGLECRNNTFDYNTSEHCWRASGCAIYGGYNNQAHHLLIRDNLEVGLRVNNDFSGAGFNTNGMNIFSDITIIRCGTFNDLFNSNVGAIDIDCNNIAGTRVNNVRFSNIDIIDSKNDAIYIYKKAGEGFYNLVFDSIRVNGTGKEYPGNNIKNLDWGRGYGILFVGNPTGYGTNCNLTYSNRGGNATSNINNAQIGTFSWKEDCSPPSSIIITSPTTFGICDSSVTFTATDVAPADTLISYMEFFVDNVSVGKDNTASYSVKWNAPAGGIHQVKAVANYPGGLSSASSIQYITVVDGLFSTATSPVIDGIADPMWNNYAPFSLDKISVGSFSGPADLTVNFKVTRDATNLYILVDVVDDILRNNGVANWQKDAVELFIDMGNDKTGSYVPNNDFQYTFVYGISTPQAGLTFAQTTKAGNLGYTMEIMIPWATLHGPQATGTFMGFELQVDDNDNNNGNRDGKKAWNDGSDNAWQSTSVLGTLQIADCASQYKPSGVVALSDKTKKINFYPNPFSSSGSLSIVTDSESSFSVNIIDMYGKVLWNKNIAGNATYTIGEQFPAGIYILEVSDGISRETTKLVKY